MAMDETTTLHTSASSSDLKRDSGIAKATANNVAASKLTLAPSASVPSIIVHDAIAASTKSKQSPPSLLRSKSKPVDEDSDADSDHQPLSTNSHSRIRSFHPIDMDIPTTTDDFADLTSPDSLKFSTRGSILLNSKKLAKMMRAHDGDMTDGDVTDNDFHTAPNSPTFSPPMQAPPSPPLSPTPSSPKQNPKR
ncbi:hypothetical protein KCU60_g23540, partial [Aureobasidium melanogenum]